MIGRAARRAADGVARLRAAGSLTAASRAGHGSAARDPDPGAARPAAPGPAAPDPAALGPAVPGPAVPGPAAARPGAQRGLRGADSPAGDVPRWLRVSAGWAWRLLLLAALLYVAGRVASMLFLVIVPFAAAILLTALLQPLMFRLRRAGLRTLSATWCTLLLAFGLIGGAAWLVTTQVEAEYPTLVTQVGHTSTQIQSWLGGAPLHIKTGNLAKISDNLVTYLRQHSSTVEGAALTGTKVVVELLAGAVLCLFITFFLIKDGARIWSWLISGMAGERGRRANLAGHAAWLAVVHYVRGTVAVAAIHAAVMGVTIAVIGSPLVAPLAVFMFIAAFVPLVGVLIAGTVACLIVLASKGLLGALIVLAVIVTMNQLEAHVLQPQLVGKMVHLHPLAVILVLATAGLVAGIPGAVVAVPITAALTSASRALRYDRAAGPPAGGEGIPAPVP
jgi:predicted PurR-regulated permease PerM